MISIKDQLLGKLTNVNEGSYKHINANTLMVTKGKISDDIPNKFIIPEKELKNLVKSRLWTDTGQYSFTSRTEDLVDFVNNIIAKKKIFGPIVEIWNKAISSITAEYSDWADNLAAGRGLAFQHLEARRNTLNGAVEELNDDSGGIEKGLNVLHFLDDLVSDSSFEDLLIRDVFDWSPRYGEDMEFSLTIEAKDEKTLSKASKIVANLARKYKFHPFTAPEDSGADGKAVKITL